MRENDRPRVLRETTVFLIVTAAILLVLLVANMIVVLADPPTILGRAFVTDGEGSVCRVVRTDDLSAGEKAVVREENGAYTTGTVASCDGETLTLAEGGVYPRERVVGRFDGKDGFMSVLASPVVSVLLALAAVAVAVLAVYAAVADRSRRSAI